MGTGMSSRTLIAGSCHINNQHKRQLLGLWARTTAWLNPDCDILVIDSCSPIELPQMPDHTMIHRIDDDAGHAFHTSGGDGWGQAFCKAVEIAGEAKYRHVMLTECDLLFARRATPIIDAMETSDVLFAAPMDPTYLFLESGLCFADVQWMKKVDFAARYDWRNFTMAELSERKLERVAGNRLFTLPLRGRRNDQHALTPDNLADSFPYGCDYITHCRDFAVYRAFLRMNGLPDE